MDIEAMFTAYAESIRVALAECFVNNPLLLAATGIFGFFGIVHSFREYVKKETPLTIMLDTLLLVFLTASLSPAISPVVLLTVLPIGTLSVAYSFKIIRGVDINGRLRDKSKEANQDREELITFVYEGRIVSLIQSVALINAEKCLQINRPEKAISYLNQCSQKVQRQPDYMIRYAQALSLMGNYHGALAKLRDLKPEDMKKQNYFIAAMELKADCCRRLNMYAEELDCYEAIIARAHGLERYYSLLGQAKIRILERSPYLSKAKEVISQRAGTPEAFASTILEDLDHALDYGTQYQAEILSYKGNCLICVKNYENGLKFLRESDHLKSNIANNYVCFGIYYLEQNNLTLAESNLKTGIAYDAQDDRAYFHLSKLYYSKRKYDRAILYVSKALALFPNRDECYDIQGKCYLAKRMYPEAISCYSKAITLHPKAEYFLSRATCYYVDPISTEQNKVNAYQDAQAAFGLEKTLVHQIELLKYQSAVWRDDGKILPKDEIDARLESFEETSQYKTQIGSIYYFCGYFEVAETYFREEYNANPNDISYIYNYALVLRQLGHSDKAAALLEKVYEPNMDDIKFYDLLLGCYCDIGDVVRSNIVQHEINCVKKRYMTIDKNTGDELFQMGKFSAAVEYYRSALVYVNTSLAVHNNLACTYIRMERYNDAIELLEKVILLKNDYPPVYYNLGCCYLLIGKHKLSEKSFQSAQRLGMRSMTKEEISSYDNTTSVLLGLDMTSSSPKEPQIIYC